MSAERAPVSATEGKAPASDRGSEPDSPAWHALPADEALSRLESRPEGLSSAEAARRLARHGPNALDLTPPTPWWRLLADQVKSLVVVLLFVAAVVALLLGDVLESAAIGAVLVLNVGLGFVIEWRARQAMEALRRLQVHEALVLRDGESRRVDARELVPGDVLVLEPGAAVPADGRLLEAQELKIVEAPLTGESMPVLKTVQPVAQDTPLAERTSQVYKGTLTAAGGGRAVVTATGRQTEIGQVSELVAITESEETPLEERLDALGRRLVWLTLGIAAVVSALGLLRGRDIWLMVETGIALAIAAVPEGLPVVATITLAVGMVRMVRRNALVRRLPAVETLGSITVLCTDKTGTLTAGEMTVTALWAAGETYEVTGRGYRAEGEVLSDTRPVGDDIARKAPGLYRLLRVAVLTNRAELVEKEDEKGETEIVPQGDPTEAALLVAGGKVGLERTTLRRDLPEVAEIPFSSDRMWMATFHRMPAGSEAESPAMESSQAGSVLALVKGAPRQVVEASAARLGPDGPEPLDVAGREELLEVNRELAQRGLRVLAFAERSLPPGAAEGEDWTRVTSGSSPFWASLVCSIRPPPRWRTPFIGSARPGCAP